MSDVAAIVHDILSFLLAALALILLYRFSQDS